jgi:hypothetical protein
VSSLEKQKQINSVKKYPKIIRQLSINKPVDSSVFQLSRSIDAKNRKEREDKSVEPKYIKPLGYNKQETSPVRIYTHRAELQMSGVMNTSSKILDILYVL